jgi:hypothetical protein
MIGLKMVNKKITGFLLTFVLILNFFLLPIPTSMASNGCEAYKNWAPGSLDKLNAPNNPITDPAGKDAIILSNTKITKVSGSATLILDHAELKKWGLSQGATHFYYHSTDSGKTWNCDVSYASVNSIPLNRNGETLAVVYVLSDTLGKIAMTPILKITSYNADAGSKCSPKDFKLTGFYDGLPGWFEIKIVDSKKVQPMKSYDENYYNGTFEEYMTEADSNNAELELYKKCMIMLNLESLTGLDYEIQYSIDNFKTAFRYKKKINLFTGYSTGRGIALIPALKKGKIHKFRAIPVNSKSPTLYFSLNTKEVRKFCDLPENKFSTKCFTEKVS